MGSDDSSFFLAKRYENVIFVSRISYDPLLGFSGAPTMILRHYMEEQMLLARIDVAISLKLVTTSWGISGIYSGNACDAFRKAKEKLTSTTINEVDESKSVIIAGSEESDLSSLTSSLNLLWNTIHAVQQNGSIVLLAEIQDNLGSISNVWEDEK